MNSNFIPFKKMLERLESSKQESDSAYFYDLLFFGEMLTKTIVLSILAGIEEDENRNKYSQLHKIVRADGIGEWSNVLDECLIGVTSQFLAPTLRDNEQRELVQKSEAGKWQYDSLNLLMESLSIVGIQSSQQALQKIQAKNWFATFASLRNGTRGHGATLPVTCSKAAIPLEKSIKIFVENFFLFKREWVYIYQNMSGKYRITNLNNSTIKFDYLKQSNDSMFQYPDGIYVFFNEKTIVELIQSEPEAIDFFFPNGNFRNKKFELISYISDKKINVDNSKYLLPASELPSSETQGLENLEVIGNCLTNLPTSYSDYINRKDLEHQLFNVLSEMDRYPIITLKGAGGIGKTSLAINIINQIAQTSRFELILWFSSRDIDLTSDGVKPVKNVMLGEDEIANEFAGLIGKKLIKKQDKINLLSQELTKSSHGNTLFVFDNFETVKNPVELFTWIDTYVRHPNKVLITSRTSKSFKADYPIEVLGMNDEECTLLIENTAKSLNIYNTLTPKLINNILSEANGHPYVIKIFLGEIAKSGKSLEIKRVIANKDDILTALFRRTFGWLSPAAKRVFLTLCSWRSMVPQIALEAVLMRQENQKIDVEEAIEELRMSSFIEVISSINDDEIFLSVPLAAALFGRNELEVSADKIAILADRELLQDFGASNKIDLTSGINSRIERKFKNIANRITQRGEPIEKHLPMLEFIASRYHPAWLYLATLYQENENLLGEENSLREYLKTDPNESIKKEIWQRLADSYKKQDDWINEVNALVEKCTLATATLFDVSEVANTLNQYIQSRKIVLDYDIKGFMTKKLIDVFYGKLSQNPTATDYSRLAWLLLRVNDQEAAINIVNKGLAIDNDNNYCIGLAEKLGI